MATSAESIFRNRSFSLYYAGQAMSFVGDGLRIIAIPLLVYHLTGSALAIGVTYALELGPFALMGLVGGSLADRTDRRKLMLLCDFVRFAIMSLFALGYATGTLKLWMLYSGIAIISMCAAVFVGGQASTIPYLLGKERPRAGRGRDGRSGRRPRSACRSDGAVEVVDDRGRPQIEGRLTSSAMRVLFDLAGAERLDQHADRMRDADGVGHLHFAAFREPGRDDVLRDVARGVGRRAVDLRRILARERAAAVPRHPAVRVGDDLAAGEAGVALGSADDEAAGRVDEDAHRVVAQLDAGSLDR
jgi:hypothetical protein